MKHWTNGYGEPMTTLEVGDRVTVTSHKYYTTEWDTTVTAVLLGMPGYYRVDGADAPVWKENIRPVAVAE